ncbi:NYN domain-containing protein [Alicyclobacillus mengziensis]|uniref:NYN domain-containing protein n=1 Tax=Alicyclobacillus mengziensis TaxID=2931921 RepID=A0A9X7Z732_9BACL|nr:NYN domain-containing protein [Alicyclobacillus mengziensis]QSO47972.1 NYN domain-containing protein [Alicyclobacillus mengziensis]
MKSSGSGGKGKRIRRKCLIVDGYNILGRISETTLGDLKNLEEMRGRLIDMLAEYQSFAGETVILVFDAHQTSGPERDIVRSGVRVIFTSYQETADDRIERLVYELRDTTPEITVATSDYAEQQVIFGGGALRISAAGLLERLRDSKKRIRRTVAEQGEQSGSRISDRIGQDIAKILEKWRRQ